MAVGYQYQSDYDKKQNKKGFKKKFIILGIGLALLVVVAVIGAPKKQAVVDNTSTEQQKTELPTKPNLVLDDNQKKIKLNTDGFLLSLVNKSDYQAFLVPLVYSSIKDKPSVLDLLNSKNLASCTLDNIEKSDNINIVTYKCSGFRLFISTLTLDDDRVLDKIANWRVIETNE